MKQSPIFTGITHRRREAFAKRQRKLFPALGSFPSPEDCYRSSRIFLFVKSLSGLIGSCTGPRIRPCGLWQYGMALSSLRNRKKGERSTTKSEKCWIEYACIYKILYIASRRAGRISPDLPWRLMSAIREIGVSSIFTSITKPPFPFTVSGNDATG